MSDINLDKVHLNWCMDILERINKVLKSNDTPDEKLAQIQWLVKQALKVERED